MAFYSSKMRVWNNSQTMWDSFQIPNFNTENLPFIVSRTLACICMLVYAYACMRHAYAKLKHAWANVYAYACLRVSVVFIFQKYLILFIKELYFSKILSSSQFQFNQALNQSWVLEFQHHWRTGA